MQSIPPSANPTDVTSSPIRIVDLLAGNERHWQILKQAFETDASMFNSLKYGLVPSSRRDSSSSKSIVAEPPQTVKALLTVLSALNDLGLLLSSASLTTHFLLSQQISGTQSPRSNELADTLKVMADHVSFVQNLSATLGGLVVVETGESTFSNPSPESDPQQQDSSTTPTESPSDGPSQEISS